MALVTITTEERSYKQIFVFNRNIARDGTVTDKWGTSSRDITESVITYRGDKASVSAAIAAAQGLNKATSIRKIDGPWWEGTATATSYGAWNTVINNPSS